jgi:L-fuculose-phosphate aldolase
MTRQVADRISSRLASQSTIFGTFLETRAVFFSDVRLTSGVVYRDDAGGHRDVREQLVSYCIRLLEDGLAVGSAGNMSVRVADTVLITPSGIAYRDMSAADICVLGLDGTLLGGSAEPSSEMPMHLAIYASTGAGAVVHTHSPEVVALSAVCDELPAIHYAIAGLGGPVRVARYTRFGSADLARAAVAALDGRSAAILGSHGAVSYGATLAQAYDRALLLEWLAHVHRLACARGTPRILTQAELDEVAAEVRRRRYGEARPIDQH